MDFEQFKIKTYTHWDLYLHKYQKSYVGRCYAWARRQDVDKVIDMHAEETRELFEKVIPEWDTAIVSLFQRDRPNVSCLGNESPHLHWHLIPRYLTPRTFQGITFIDPNPKGNYAPYSKEELPLEILLQIRDAIRKKL